MFLSGERAGVFGRFSSAERWRRSGTFGKGVRCDDQMPHRHRSGVDGRPTSPQRIPGRSRLFRAVTRSGERVNGAALRGERSGACARSRFRRCVLRLLGWSRRCVLWRRGGFGGAFHCCGAAGGVPALSRRFSCAGFGGYSLRAVFCGKYSARRILSKVTTEERRGCGDRSGGGAATRKGLSECSDSPFSAERSDGGCAAAIVCDYNRGPAATSALPSSLPVNLVKFFTKRLARSTAFVFHSSAFL